MILYNNCDIPAKLFYNEVIGKSNLSVLGSGTDKELESALYGIIDELCEIEQNRELVNIYKKKDKIDRIQTLINYIETVLYDIVFIKLTEEERNDFIDILNSIDYIKIKFDKKKDILSEVERVQKSVIGMLKNQINHEKGEVDKKEQKYAGFEKELVRLEQILPSGYINPDCTLRLYAEYKTLAKEISREKNASHGK